MRPPFRGPQWRTILRNGKRFWLRFGRTCGVLIIALVVTLAVPGRARACACGCGVFEVGPPGLMHPIQLGGFASFEWDYSDQSHNWSGTSEAPAADNDDKRIKTNFYNFNFQYMFDRSWGLMVNVPYWNRYFLTTADDGSLAAYHYSSLGDMRVQGVYSGFSEDMCTGITFGFKLPTGDYTFPGPDRDNQIGTGSTDTLLGFYHQGGLTRDNTWVWFGQALWDNAIATRNDYRPGDEVDVSAGVYFNGGQLSSRSSLAPVLQFLFSERWRDSGLEADPDNTGFTRLFIAPAVQFNYSDLQFYAQVGFPIYQRMNGNQLVAKELYKVSLGYSF
jgi:hypothetical protein